MKTLSQKQINNFKIQFLKHRQAILETQAKLSEEDIDGGGDEVDLIQGILIKSMIEKLSARDQETLCALNQALQRIETGNFGRCEDCEEFIAEKRLLALPYCKYCIDCAEEQEKLRRISR